MTATSAFPLAPIAGRTAVQPEPGQIRPGQIQPGQIQAGQIQAGRHSAPGTATRTGNPGRHRRTGRGRLAHPVVISTPARPAGPQDPTAGGRPAPLTRPAGPVFSLIWLRRYAA